MLYHLPFRITKELEVVLDNGETISGVVVRPEKSRGAQRYYVSFCYDCYRYYARRCLQGVLCVAIKTRDYQYANGGATHATKVRLDKVWKNKRNSHAKSLY